MKESCGGEVVEMEEKSELDLAPNASEASNQLRRSPNSSDEGFVSLGTGIKSATRVWRCCGGCQLFVVIDEEEKRRGRIFLGRVDEVETELELAESQATNKASSRGGEAPTHRAHPAQVAPSKCH